MTHIQVPEELLTLRDYLRWAISRFNQAQLSYGHGTDNACDEAAYLILHTLHLPQDQLNPFLDARLTVAERQALTQVINRRIDERCPAAYITREAWLGDFKFYVDERTIVPRSHFAELLRENFSPWIVDPESVDTALDLCTGSGCLAILMAHAFPNARIDAVDVSDDALQVAEQNVADYALEQRITLHRSDLFDGLKASYDIIISNPPYVTDEAMTALPQEYRREPALALGAGEDGMDIVRRIIGKARRYLKPHGILAVEVGGNRALAEEAFPELPFIWLETEGDTEAVFLLRQDELPES